MIIRVRTRREVVVRRRATMKSQPMRAKRARVLRSWDIRKTTGGMAGPRPAVVHYRGPPLRGGRTADSSPTNGRARGAALDRASRLCGNGPARPYVSFRYLNPSAAGGPA